MEKTDRTSTYLQQNGIKGEEKIDNEVSYVVNEVRIILEHKRRDKDKMDLNHIFMMILRVWRKSLRVRDRKIIIGSYVVFVLLFKRLVLGDGKKIIV